MVGFKDTPYQWRDARSALNDEAYALLYAMCANASDYKLIPLYVLMWFRSARQLDLVIQKDDNDITSKEGRNFIYDLEALDKAIAEHPEAAELN